MPRTSTRFCWLAVLALAVACGGSEKKKPPPKVAEEPPPAPSVAVAGALKETLGLGRTAALTKLSDKELVDQGYFYIGTVSATPGPDAQQLLLDTAGEHGGELVKPVTPDSVDVLGVTQGDCTAPAGDEGASEEEAKEEEEEEASETPEGEGEEAEATPSKCADAKPFPMLGMVWTRPGDAPDDALEKWMMQDGVRKLHIAVAKQDLEGISELVSDGIDINAPDALGRYALYKAALTGDGEYVAMIVGLGAAADPPPMWGRTLLENIVDVELRRYHGTNFLTFDIEAHKKILEVLLGTGTDATSALERAVEQGFCETAEHIVALGTKGAGCDDASKTAEEDRKTNAVGQAYRFALDEGKFDTVKDLLKKGVDVAFTQAGTKWQAPPMNQLIADGNAEAVEFLLKNKVEHSFEDAPESRGLLCAAARKANKFMVQTLLKAGIDLTGSLHCATVSSDAKKMVPMFLAARVDVDGVDEEGITPLYFCVRETLAELRKKHGYEGDAAPEDPKKEYKADRDALDKTLGKIINLLLKKGANPTLAPEGAPTVVELATSHGLKKTGKSLEKAAKKKK